MTHRAQQLGQYWNWLPAFRIVAEHESLADAARILRVGAPALSRTIKHLEGHIGASLFSRHGRQLRLTDEGRILLLALRSSMRSLDDAIANIGEKGPLTVRIAAPVPFVRALLLPFLRSAAAQGRQFVAELVVYGLADAVIALHRGDVDYVLSDDRPFDGTGLQIRKLGGLNYSVYCGAQHPLHSKVDVSLADVLEHPFVTAPLGEDDHWPAEVVRIIGLRTSSLHLGVDLCKEGAFLAVLPDAIVTRVAEGTLLRLPGPTFPVAGLFAMTRKPVGKAQKGRLLDDITDAVANALRVEQP